MSIPALCLLFLLSLHLDSIIDHLFCSLRISPGCIIPVLLLSYPIHFLQLALFWDTVRPTVFTVHRHEYEWGGGGTDSDNTKVKHVASINSNNDHCWIRKGREWFCFKKCFHNLIVAVVCVLFKTFRDYSWSPFIKKVKLIMLRPFCLGNFRFLMTSNYILWETLSSH